MEFLLAGTGRAPGDRRSLYSHPHRERAFVVDGLEFGGFRSGLRGDNWRAELGTRFGWCYGTGLG